MATRSRREYLLGLAAATVLAGCTGTDDWRPGQTDTDDPSSPGKVDDWQYDPQDQANATAGNTRTSGGGGGASATAAPQTEASADVGFAVGGAKDVNNFRQNIEEDYLPLPTDVSYEGLFYDYYFDTGGSGACSSLFCPTYSAAISADPLSGAPERYVTVGLNSGIQNFERKPLNLVVVLDISGSMSSGFGEYYYDRTGERQAVEDPSRSKMDVATEAVADLTRQMGPDDRFGMVLFNNQSHLAKPVRAVEQTDMEAIRGHIREIEAGGGTKLSAGIQDATAMLEPYTDVDPQTRETRTIVVTDAMPNLGEISSGGLRERLAANAHAGHFTTFVGVGVDFNTEIVDRITAIRGANYYSVRSPAQFERRLVEEFEYMVTPLVFDLSVSFEGSGFEIEQVYGSTAADESTGEVLRANTLFPSPRQEGRTKGGVILAKLRKTGEQGQIRLQASWQDRAGTPGSTSTVVAIGADSPEHFDTSGIRKAVLLTRYADLLKNWAIDERERNGEPRSDGISVPPESDPGRWERQSTPLRVSPEYRSRFTDFAQHFASELDVLGDDSLEQELAILRELANGPNDHDGLVQPVVSGW